MMLVHEKDGEFSICSLTPGKIEQQPLDIVVLQGDNIHLRVEGTNPVHLVGYHIHDSGMMDEEEYSDAETINSENMASDYDSMEDEYETEDSEEEEECSSCEEGEDVKPVKKQKRNSPKISLVNSDGESVSEEGSEEEGSDEEFDSEDIDSDEFDSDEIDSDEFDSEEDEEEEMTGTSEQEEEEIDNKKRTAPAANVADSKKPKLITPQDSPKATKVQEPVKKTETPKKVVEETPKIETPKKSTEKKVETPKQLAPQKENAQPNSPASALVKKTLPSGLGIEDLSLGQGIKAQKGRTVDVIVSLTSEDGKSIGKPQKLSFKVGDQSNNTSKGLDMGVVGMALNGERKLVIPAELAKGINAAPSGKTVLATVKLEKVINNK